MSELKNKLEVPSLLLTCGRHFYANVNGFYKSHDFRSADVLSGRHFVRTGLDVLSGRHFVRTALDVLSGRRFVRTALPVVRGSYEWLWVSYRVVSGDFGWFLVVTSGCESLWVVMGWLSLSIA